jgi:hypothetical protein
MLGAGAASIFIVTRPNADPLSYLLWAWFLWMYALVALLTTWSSKRPAISPSGPIDTALAANQNTGKISMREQAPTLPSGGTP